MALFFSLIKFFMATPNNNSPELDAAYWNLQYQQQLTGWDMGTVSPPLKAYIDQLTDRSIRLLIPGCGYAHEAEYLLQLGFQNITLIDISSEACQTLQEKFKDQTAIKILNEDFFEHKGQYDLILEQTFFCALNPQFRSLYPRMIHNLLAKKGKLVGLFFTIEFMKSGPPFGGSTDYYAHLFYPYFESKVFKPCYNSHPKRQGSELYVILKPKLCTVSTFSQVKT